MRRAVYIVLLCISFLFIGYYAAMSDLKDPQEPVFSYEDGWVFEGNGQTGKLNRLKAFAPAVLEQNSARFSNTLPENLSGNSSFGFISHNISFSLLIDNEQRYEFFAEPNLTGIGYGRLIHDVNLEEEDAGKVITFEIYPVYNDYRGGIFDIFVCPTRMYNSIQEKRNYYKDANNRRKSRT